LAEIGRFTAGTFRSSRLPLLNLPEDVLLKLRQGKLEYTKAQAIARVKDKEHRGDLLAQVIMEDLPLSEIKSKVKEMKPEAEENPEQVFVHRFGELGKRLQKSNVLKDPRKLQRIKKLLDELENLTMG
jgi:ParB family chromosome partitioning protein